MTNEASLKPIWPPGSSVVLVVLWLNPRYSGWVAARIIATRAMAIRSAELAKRWARCSPPKRATH